MACVHRFHHISQSSLVCGVCLLAQFLTLLKIAQLSSHDCDGIPVTWSTEEDCEMQLNAPEKVRKWTLSLHCFYFFKYCFYGQEWTHNILQFWRLFRYFSFVISSGFTLHQTSASSLAAVNSNQLLCGTKFLSSHRLQHCGCWRPPVLPHPELQQTA